MKFERPKRMYMIIAAMTIAYLVVGGVFLMYVIEIISFIKYPGIIISRTTDIILMGEINEYEYLPFNEYYSILFFFLMLVPFIGKKIIKKILQANGLSEEITETKKASQTSYGVTRITRKFDNGRIAEYCDFKIYSITTQHRKKFIFGHPQL